VPRTWVQKPQYVPELAPDLETHPVVYEHASSRGEIATSWGPLDAGLTSGMGSEIDSGKAKAVGRRRRTSVSLNCILKSDIDSFRRVCAFLIF